MSVNRRWEVLLIGGASGVGKTSVGYRIARHFAIGIIEIDDFQLILESMTSPERYPDLHLWRRDPERFLGMSEDEKLAFMIRYATFMAEPIEYVIGNHLSGGPPIVLEGDFLLPSVAARTEHDRHSASGRVQGLFTYEPDEAQIAHDYFSREGERQPVRARLSWRYSDWLRDEAERLGPWSTGARRAPMSVSTRAGAGTGLDRQRAV